MGPNAEEALASFFQSLGHPIRMQILHLLQAAGEMNVGQIVERLGLTQGHVSNHLACLRTCGAVSARQEGRWVYYRLSGDGVRQILEVGRRLVDPRAEEIAACPVLMAELRSPAGEVGTGQP